MSGSDRRAGWIRRRLGLPLLLLFTLILVIATIPPEFTPASLEPVVGGARGFLWRLGFTAGQSVFHGQMEIIKHRLMCLKVFGETAPGSFEEIYASYPACRPPVIRWHDSMLDARLKAPTWVILEGNPNLTAMLRRIRRHPDQDQVARYFCQRFRRRGVLSVIGAFKYQVRDYRTGTVTEYNEIIIHYACRQRPPLDYEVELVTAGGDLRLEVNR